nr:DUF6111 family protein [uncultured Dongia sp.]
MMRAILEVIIPLALPALLYWLYLRIQERRGVTVREVPLSWLAVIGVVLLIISLGAGWLAGSEPPTGKYVPPKVVDGVVVPGHFE